MQSIDTSRSGTTISSGARSAPDERSGDRSECQASFPKQTTAKIRCTADRANLEADIESVPRPRRWDFHAGAVGAASAAGNGALSRRPRQPLLCTERFIVTRLLNGMETQRRRCPHNFSVIPGRVIAHTFAYLQSCRGIRTARLVDPFTTSPFQPYDNPFKRPLA